MKKLSRDSFSFSLRSLEGHSFFSGVGILTLISALERITNQTLTDLTSVLCGHRIYHHYRKGHLFTVGYFEGPTSI